MYTINSGWEKPNGLKYRSNYNSIPPIEGQNQLLNINGFIASTDSFLEEDNRFHHLVSTISVIKFRLNSIKHVYSNKNGPTIFIR